LVITVTDLRLHPVHHGLDLGAGEGVGGRRLLDLLARRRLVAALVDPGQALFQLAIGSGGALFHGRGHEIVERARRRLGRGRGPLVVRAGPGRLGGGRRDGRGRGGDGGNGHDLGAAGRARRRGG